MKKVGIIGSGLSSLYAACTLAKAGYRVSVFEKNAGPGGRVRSFSAEGFTFDMGPSWYWMPDIVDQLFAELDEPRENYFDLHRLENAYKVFWKHSESTIIPADHQELLNLFDTFEPDGGKKLERFLSDAKVKYEIAKPFLDKPGLRFTELLDRKALTGALKLDVFKSVAKDVSKRFSSDKARNILNFPVIFLGAMPDEIPAMYTLMNYADLELGTWYPKHGMTDLPKALVKIAQKYHTQFFFNANVDQILAQDGKAVGIKVNGEDSYFDYLISGADYHHTEQQLIPEKYRRYDSNYWDSRKMAPSSLIFYLGLNRKIEGLEHHNLFFDEDLKFHGHQIYEDPKWPEKPLFYVCAPSKTDPHVAPENCENLFILMPIATSLEDNDAIRSRYFELFMDRLSHHTGVSIREHVIYKRSFCINQFQSEYNSYKGNAYGLANTLLQTANFKPKMKSKLENLYFCGQLTVPGPGIPPSLISGKIAANQILKKR